MCISAQIRHRFSLAESNNRFNTSSILTIYFFRKFKQRTKKPCSLSACVTRFLLQLDFDWIFRNIVMREVLLHSRTPLCVLRWRHTCRRIRSLVDTYTCVFCVASSCDSLLNCSVRNNDFALPSDRFILPHLLFKFFLVVPKNNSDLVAIRKQLSADFDWMNR